MKWIFGLLGAGVIVVLTIAGSDHLFLKAVPLEQRLVSNDEIIRKKAQQELLGLGGDSKRELASRLIPSLSGPQLSTRKWAAISIALMGPAAQDAIPALLHGVSDQAKEVSQACRVALSEIGTPDDSQYPALLRGLTDPQEAVRCEAAAGLSRMGPQAKGAIPVFLEQLQSGRAPECILKATAALLSRSPERQNNVFLLLRDANVETRYSAARVLSLLENKSPDVIRVLIDVLASDTDSRTRQAAAHGLGLPHPPDRGQIPTLTYTVRHAKEEAARIAALTAVGKCDWLLEERVKFLGSVLSRDPYPSIKVLASRQLMEVGPAARSVAGILCEALDDEHEEVRRTALITLRSLDMHGRQRLTQIARLQKDPSPEIRCLAAEQLVETGAWDRVSVHGLISDLSDPLTELPCAGEALALDGHFNPEVSQALIQLLQNGSAESRRRAAAVLIHLGARARDALPALARAQREGIPGSRTAARAIREALLPVHRHRR